MDKHVCWQRGGRRVDQVHRNDRSGRARRFQSRLTLASLPANASVFRIPARPLFHIWSSLLNPICRLALIVVSCCWFSLAHGEDADWPVYLGGKERNLYSQLEQINRENVSQLEVAWTYETGDAAEYQANNLIVQGVLYTPTQTRKVVALNAATGEELWKWDPADEHTGAAVASNETGNTTSRQPVRE